MLEKRAGGGWGGLSILAFLEAREVALHGLWQMVSCGRFVIDVLRWRLQVCTEAKRLKGCGRPWGSVILWVARTCNRSNELNDKERQ